jgi:pimeloyl-ACP methyl ester carboxylesterase
MKWLAGICFALAGLAAGGCMLLDARQQQQEIDAYCQISGSVSAERKDPGTIVVVLLRQGDGAWQPVDHFVLEQAGKWAFVAGAGRYALAAFEDRSLDRGYQVGESYAITGFERPIACGSGSRHADIALAIPQKAPARFPYKVDLSRLEVRSLDRQMYATLGQMTALGEIARLTDARFSDENAEGGLWRPLDFLVTARAGIYFLEPYDARRIPVLFVHGINGSPANFSYLVERLDRTRFQAWVYYYPSGGHLDLVAGHLDQTVQKLQLRHGFTRFIVVAHSMGGLVSRGFIQRHAASSPSSRMPLFVSISTPWGGHKAAELGVKTSPVVVRSWEDMAPGSAYQRSLYSTPLPAGMQHHLLFTFNRKTSSFGESDDQTVTVASQLLPQAQRDAFKLYGFDDSHMGVLQEAQVSLLLNQILAGQGNR